jgi:hypothetical protein
MQRYTILAALAVLTLFGLARQASAQQAVPNIRGLQAFSPQARYMSLTGYLRCQYFMENNVWISQVEAQELVRSQEASPSTSVAVIL